MTVLRAEIICGKQGGEHNRVLLSMTYDFGNRVQNKGRVDLERFGDL